MVDSDDPVAAELARLIRASSVLDPLPGAQRRIRAALIGSAQTRLLRRKPPLIAFLLAIAMPGAFATMYLRQPRDPAPALPAALHDLRPESDIERVPAPTLAAALLPDEPRASEPPPPVSSKLDLGAQRSERRTSKPDPGKRPPRGRSASLTTGSASPGALPSASPPPTTEAAAASPAPAPAPAPARSEPAALVLGALHSLRRDHDARAALRQLDTYRQQFPSGNLAEETLALTIEALSALDDSAALSFADEYLQRFPDGQFRQQAERAQHRFRGAP